VQSFVDGERDAAILTNCICSTLNHASIERVDYVAVVDAETLEPLTLVDRSAVALVAAFVGNTRLIDNAVLDIRHLDAAL
jgi:pantoate--beta-alanine ligase